MITIKKFYRTVLFVAVLCLIMGLITGCEKKESKNTDVSKVLAKMKDASGFSPKKEESLKDGTVSQRYGINPGDVEEGFVCLSTDEKSPDRIIIVKAKNKSVLENIEGALSAEAVGLKDAWADDEEKAEKVSKHLLKTRDVYVVLAVSDNSEKVEKVFDEMV